MEKKLKKKSGELELPSRICGIHTDKEGPSPAALCEVGKKTRDTIEGSLNNMAHETPLQSNGRCGGDVLFIYFYFYFFNLKTVGQQVETRFKKWGKTQKTKSKIKDETRKGFVLNKN
jgi:hypothetical protein